MRIIPQDTLSSYRILWLSAYHFWGFEALRSSIFEELGNETQNSTFLQSGPLSTVITSVLVKCTSVATVNLHQELSLLSKNRTFPNRAANLSC